MVFDIATVQTIYSFARTNSLFGVLATIAASWLIWGLFAWYVVAFVWHKRGGLRELAALLLGGGLGYTTNKLISLIWFRPRPFVTLHLTPLITVSDTKSFPSDHATAAFFVATLLYLHRPKWWWAYLLAGVVALGRVAVGVHYPSDILVGALIGVTFGFVTRWLERLFQVKSKI